MGLRISFLSGAALFAAVCAPEGARAQDPTASGVCPPSEFVIYFEWDRAVLGPSALETIDNAIAAGAGCNIGEVAIVGHADTSGSPSYNLGLSERRASAVRDALLARGIVSDAIVTRASGETELARATRDGVREPINRRVAVSFEYIATLGYVRVAVTSASAMQFHAIRSDLWADLAATDAARRTALVSSLNFGPYDVGAALSLRADAQYRLTPLCGDTVAWERTVMPVIRADTSQIQVSC